MLRSSSLNTKTQLNEHREEQTEDKIVHWRRKSCVCSNCGTLNLKGNLIEAMMIENLNFQILEPELKEIGSVI